MPKYNTKGRSRRVKNLMVITTLSALLLAISTYAWFVGMRSVHVEAFQVEIAATDSLLLSFDGENFDEVVRISKEMLDTVSYSGHTNKWDDLIPVSSIGQMDSESSRMMLFEKASLTASRGGFRLLASRVNNFKDETTQNISNDHEGYVVFDLFIKNYSGNHYIDILDIRDEEAIYLTIDSEVKVADGGVPNTGIENSVRVAFAQIGRVNEQNTEADIVGITCDDVGGTDGTPKTVTGICRTAQIWEPNDTKHVPGAINWYEEACKKRNETGYNVMEDDSFNGVCETISNGTAYPTYAVSKEILNTKGTEANPHVDIYDGFNLYKKSITDFGVGGFDLEPEDPETLELSDLTEYPYFTDTHKTQTGTNREAFMYLAPNSVTKVRVYIYIEGQDIDNYDFAQIGKKISIKFGFTKERFIGTDITYEGPGLDLEKPVITLYGHGAEEPYEGELDRKDGIYVMEIAQTEEGTFADDYAPVADYNDNSGADKLETSVTGLEDVKVDEPGIYTVYYRAADETGNRQTELLVVTVTEKE